MKTDDDDPTLIIKMPSALFATVLLIVARMFLNNSRVHNACIMSYASVLAISGWSFAIAGWRVAGLIHSILMFGIASFCFYVCFNNFNAPLADNPAAGLIGTVTLVYFIVGVLSGLCTIGIIYLLLKPK